MAAPSGRGGGRRAAAAGTPPVRSVPAPALPPRPLLAPDRPLLIGHGSDPDAIRLRNFDTPEEEFAWSMGRFAEAVFDCDPGALAAAAGGALLLDIDTFRVPPVLAGQNLLVFLNGLRVHSAFVTARSILAIQLRPGMLRAAENTLTFDLPDAIRPMEFGMEDGRMLGLKLFSIALEPAA